MHRPRRPYREPSSARTQHQIAGDSSASKACCGNREHPAIGEVSGKRRPSRKIERRSCGDDIIGESGSRTCHSEFARHRKNESLNV